MYVQLFLFVYFLLVLQLHREFALCGADVLQAFVFNGTDDRLNQFREGKDKLDVSNHLVVLTSSVSTVPVRMSSINHPYLQFISPVIPTANYFLLQNLLQKI